MEIGGVPGEFAWILFSSEAQPAFLPALFASLIPATPINQIFAGALDGTGNASLQVTPTLAPGFLGKLIVAQALHYSVPEQTFALGPPTSVVILDASY